MAASACRTVPWPRAITSRPPSSPTLTQEMRIAREEIFGPVIAIIEVDGYDDAIAQANDTEYGLSAAIATTNAGHAHRFAKDIQAGTVKINRTTTGNLINAPFGGLKRSSTVHLPRIRQGGAGVLYPDQDGASRRLEPPAASSLHRTTHRQDRGMKQVYRGWNWKRRAP